MVYNFDPELFEAQKLQEGQDQRLLWDLSSLISSVLFNVENLQGVLGDNDLLAAQFNCVNDGVVLCSAELEITKMNKSAEVLLNSSSQLSIGKRVSELFGVKNSHLMKPISEVSQSQPYATLLKTQIQTAKGTTEVG